MFNNTTVRMFCFGFLEWKRLNSKVMILLLCMLWICFIDSIKFSREYKMIGPFIYNWYSTTKKNYDSVLKKMPQIFLFPRTGIALTDRCPKKIECQRHMGDMMWSSKINDMPSLCSADSIISFEPKRSRDPVYKPPKRRVLWWARKGKACPSSEYLTSWVLLTPASPFTPHLPVAFYTFILPSLLLPNLHSTRKYGIVL